MAESRDLAVLERLAAPVFERFGVRRAGFFGSQVKQEAGPDSDLDIVVELPGESTLYDQIRLQMELSDALGMEAHVSTYGSLHPGLKDRILYEEVRVLG